MPLKAINEASNRLLSEMERVVNANYPTTEVRRDWYYFPVSPKRWTPHTEPPVRRWEPYVRPYRWDRYVRPYQPKEEKEDKEGDKKDEEVELSPELEELKRRLEKLKEELSGDQE